LNLYTTFTPSHRSMYTDHFLATLPEEFELHAFEDDDQPCPTGTFYEAGWAETCFRKVDVFLRACRECMGGTFFYSDVDVQFFGPIRERLLLELGEHDIACQQDRDRHCSGLFVCRANESTLRMFEAMRSGFAHDDQTTLNRFIGRTNATRLSDRFFNYGQIASGRWTKGPIETPPGMLAHHANHVVGVPAKIRMMQEVRGRWESRRFAPSEH
jgi:hypothetical protein